MEDIYSMSKEEREAMGLKGRAHVMKNYNFEDFNKNWVDLLTNLHEEEGSWKTRKKQTAWVLKEISA